MFGIRLLEKLKLVFVELVVLFGSVLIVGIGGVVVLSVNVDIEMKLVVLRLILRVHVFLCVLFSGM